MPVLSAEPSVTVTEAVTLAIAVAGFLLALAALGWQIVTFVASGSRVKVEIENGLIMHTDDSGKTYIGITARNVGRTPVDVDQWYFDIKDADNDGKLVVAQPEPWVGPEVPYRLEPGQSVGWRMYASEIRAALAAHGHASDTPLRGRVTLGDGKDVRSGESMKAPQFD